MTTATPDSPRRSYRLPFTPPTWMIYTMVFMVVASWIPLALIAKERASKSREPRIHIFQDMDVQPRFGPQSFAGAEAAQLNKDYGDLFVDKRGMRPRVPGTVAREDHAGPQNDDHYYRGYKTDADMKPVLVGDAKQPDFLAGLPSNVKLSKELLEHGRQRYEIYCALCHGSGGYGDGPVQRRIASSSEQAGMLGQPSPVATWVPPRNLHQANVVPIKEGRLYHVISEGMGTMRGYKQQIPVADRWAIVAYVKALQASQNVPTDYAGTLGIDVAKLPIDKKPPPPKTIEVTDKPAPDPEWIDDPALIAKGKTLFTTKICMTCHQVDPAVPAPAGVALKATPFIGKFWHEKRTVTKGPGGEEMEVFFDWPYVNESIEKPMAKIVKGSIPGMAPLPTTPEERKALTAYIKSLSE